jgi:hypothetical protein
MWHRVDAVLTDVSEERIVSIFRVEGKIRKSASEDGEGKGLGSRSKVRAGIGYCVGGERQG